MSNDETLQNIPDDYRLADLDRQTYSRLRAHWLEEDGLETVGAVRRASDYKLARIPNIGNTTIQRIREKLGYAGQSTPEPKPESSPLENFLVDIAVSIDALTVAVKEGNKVAERARQETANLTALIAASNAKIAPGLFDTLGRVANILQAMEQRVMATAPPCRHEWVYDKSRANRFCVVCSKSEAWTGP